MRIRGYFIEDLEALQEHYQRKFIHYSSEYHFKGSEKAKSKMYDYQNCFEKISKVLKLVNDW